MVLDTRYLAPPEALQAQMGLQGSLGGVRKSLVWLDWWAKPTLQLRSSGCREVAMECTTEENCDANNSRLFNGVFTTSHFITREEMPYNHLSSLGEARGTLPLESFKTQWYSLCGNIEVVCHFEYSWLHG